MNNSDVRLHLDKYWDALYGLKMDYHDANFAYLCGYLDSFGGMVKVCDACRILHLLGHKLKISIKWVGKTHAAMHYSITLRLLNG